MSRHAARYIGRLKPRLISSRSAIPAAAASATSWTRPSPCSFPVPRAPPRRLLTCEPMEPRLLTTAERETQILAPWKGRPPARRGPEDPRSCYPWAVDDAPWLLPSRASSADHVRSVIEDHTISPDEARDSAAKE